MYHLSNNSCHSQKTNNLLNMKAKRKLDLKKLMKMSEKYIKIAFKVLAIVSVSIFLITSLGLISSGQDKTKLVQVKVDHGDTLWKIADNYYDNNVDLRKMIFRIKKINNLNSAMLQPGQSLKIPIK